jgi:hypothetical protein
MVAGLTLPDIPVSRSLFAGGVIENGEIKASNDLFKTGCF